MGESHGPDLPRQRGDQPTMEPRPYNGTTFAPPTRGSVRQDPGSTPCPAAAGISRRSPLREAPTVTTKQQFRTDRDGYGTDGFDRDERDPSGFDRAGFGPAGYNTDGYRAGLLKRLRIRLPRRGLLSQRRGNRNPPTTTLRDRLRCMTCGNANVA